MHERAIVAMLLAAALPAAATAQIVGKTVVRGLNKDDIAALDPVIQKSLTDAKIGEARPWHSANGTAGNVRLLSGGAVAGDKCGRVQLTVMRAGVETRGYKFNYCRDAGGRWRTTG